MKPIRVAYIDSGDPDAPEGSRLRLELHRKYDGYRWYDVTSEQWIDSHDIKTVADAMDTLYAWYDVPAWSLVVGHRDRK